MTPACYGTDPRFVSPERLVFRDLITGSNTSGKQFVCRGEFEVVIDQIPPDPPTDWSMGPTMRPGEWGAYRAHEFYPAGHGPYAFATGKSREDAEVQAAGHFLGTFCLWPRLTSEQRLKGADRNVTRKYEAKHPRADAWTSCEASRVVSERF